MTGAGAEYDRRMLRVLAHIDNHLGQALRNGDQAAAGEGGEHGDSHHPSLESLVNIDVAVIERSAVRVACLRHTGPYGPAVGAFWQCEFAPFVRSRGLFGRSRYGIGHDNPDIVEPRQLRHDAAIEVEADFVPPNGVFLAELPAGRYAQADFEGTSETIQAAWTALMREWLPTTGRFGCQLLVSVEPLFEGGR
jgi:AraC family transcriptional regulator